MTVAAAQYAQFKERAVREGLVFTFTDADAYLVFPVRGYEVIPFWSSRARLEKIQEKHPQYRRYKITEMNLAEFLDWLEKRERDGIRVGTNWSGIRLIGYDVEPKDLLLGLQYWIDKGPSGNK